VTDARADLFCCTILLSEMLLGENIFESGDEARTRRNILELTIPNFTERRPDVDEKLNGILQRGFQRDRDTRYQSAQAMLMALEVFLYGDGYGPTNEKLAIYIRDLFGSDGRNAAERWSAGKTPGLEQNPAF